MRAPVDNNAALSQQSQRHWPRLTRVRLKTHGVKVPSSPRAPWTVPARASEQRRGSEPTVVDATRQRGSEPTVVASTGRVCRVAASSRMAPGRCYRREHIGQCLRAPAYDIAALSQRL